MPTTTNYSWTTPADTDLVKDGAAAIRTLGSSIDTTTKNLNPQTTTGAIAYRSATNNVNTSLPIGTAGQILTVNSGATAPEWAAAPAAGWSPNLTLLNAGGTALTGAGTITVNVSSFDSYFVIIDAGSGVSSSIFVRLRINADGGNNYGYTNVGLAGTAVSADSGYNASIYNLGRMGNNGADTFTGMITILGGKTTGLKPINSVFRATGASTNNSYATNGYYYGTAAITSISLLASTGDFDAGTVYVYGG